MKNERADRLPYVHLPFLVGGPSATIYDLGYLVDVDGVSFYRLTNSEFKTVEWQEVKKMDGMCDPVDKRREKCAMEEARKERTVGAEYMRQRHGLVESREPAYRPVGGKGKRKGKY
jgi:hypothetical protein